MSSILEMVVHNSLLGLLRRCSWKVDEVLIELDVQLSLADIEAKLQVVHILLHFREPADDCEEVLAIPIISWPNKFSRCGGLINGLFLP